MQQNLPITIYGDGTQTRDFIYVKDVAIAFTKALTAPIASGDSLICNIGTGNSISLMQLINSLKPCFPDWNTDIRFAPARTGDILHSEADITQAVSNLGFSPRWPLQSSMQPFVQSLFVRS